MGSEIPIAAEPFSSYVSVLECSIKRHPTSNLYLGALRDYLLSTQRYPNYVTEPHKDQIIHSIGTSSDDKLESFTTEASNLSHANCRAYKRIWLRIADGLTGPTTVSRLGLEHKIRPEAFLGHLEVERLERRIRTSFELPSVPLTRDNIYHIWFTSLGSFNDTEEMTAILQLQARADSHVKDLERRLFTGHKYGQFRIRKLDMHNDRYFSVEHRITFTVGRDGTGICSASVFFLSEAPY